MPARTLTAAAIATACAAVTAAAQDASNVAFPEGYATAFVRFDTVDKPERTPPIVRFFYIDEVALAEAEAGAPLPHGSVVVMEDHEATLDADGTPVTDANGRFVPTARLTNVFVQEKQAGWGETVPEALRNGDWLYAWFDPADRSRKTTDAGNLDSCYECHKEQAAATDSTFVTRPFVDRIKGGR